MNSAYTHFKEKHFKYLLDGQAEILVKLEDNILSQLDNEFDSYYPTLVRMPTGTGKTGVIAIASFFGNSNGSTLILTPWKTLCTQMMDDLRIFFWNKVRLSQEEKEKYIFKTNRLWPSKLGKFLDEKQDKRFILVGTLNGLQRLENKYLDIYDSLKEKISLVVVDEGHYEPAVLWGRAVKHLNRPTLLLTATPYRNDLRLFKVPSDRVFHYEHFRAINAKKKPLRRIDSIQLEADSKNLEEVIYEFLNIWKNDLKNRLPDASPRAIICCQNKISVMKALEIVFDEGFSVCAFHERVEDEDFDHRPELKALFIKNVPQAKNTHEEIWIHQHKLTEGVDDPRFCSILFTYPINNDRKLVQQVGRVLRHSDYTKSQKEQKAIIVHCANYNFKEVWENYLHFEKDIRLTTGEHFREVISNYLKLQPDYEYFGKRFRKRLTPFPFIDNQGISDKKELAKQREEVSRSIVQWQKEGWEMILTPPSVLILKIQAGFDLNEFIGAMTDSLLLRDTVILNVEGEDKPLINEPNGTVLWLYALIKNSDILLSRSAYEISIEARFFHQVGNYLFLGDTSGIAYDEFISKFAYSCNYFDLAKCLNYGDIVKQASLFNTQSLNTAVRRTIRQGINLDAAPYQISESKYVCQNLRAKLNGIPGERYFGFTSGRISDRINQERRRDFNLRQFIEWVNVLAEVLEEESEPHPFFSRYATLTKAPNEANPYALILDPDPDPSNVFGFGNNDYDEKVINWVTKSKVNLDLEETVFIFENSTNDDWPFLIRIQIDNSGNLLETQVLCRYKPMPGIFQFRKGKQTDFEVIYNNDVFSVAQLFNAQNHRYAITLKEPELVYHNKQFFKIDYSQAEAKFTTYFSTIPYLKDVDFEKIPKSINENKKEKNSLKVWPDRSVFSVALSKILIKKYFGNEIEWLYCDDPQKEVADFILANFTKKEIVFAHCKYGKGREISVSAFHDLCSQAAKSLVYLKTNRYPPNIAYWNKKAFWEGTKIKKWLFGLPGLPENEKLWEKIKDEILNHPSGKKYLWLILGNGLDISKLTSMAGSVQETKEIGPLLHLLDGLVANCAEAGVELKIFGS